ncbi:MAG: hypothetical protein JO291_04080 [Acidimicrobiia bacterium]|nr:hypothetical protein [Acidimicrobiia bacterium]
MSDDRLRRQLQAQAVVNRQLHAQLAEVTAELRAVKGNDANTVRVLWQRIESVLPRSVASKVERRVRGALGTPAGPRRARPARPAARERTETHDWLDELHGTGPLEDEPTLVQDPEGDLFVIEGSLRRPVPRMIVGALLTAEMGQPEPVTAEVIGELDEGPPVDLLQAPSGPPFVIVGGRRRPVNGLAIPHDVEDDQAERFEEGRPLRVYRLQQAVAAKRQEGTTSSAAPAATVVGRIRARWPG